MLQSFVCDTKPWFCVAGGEGLAPPRLRPKTMVLRNVSLLCAVADNCVVGMARLAPPLLRRKTVVLCRKQEGHVCGVTQQTCLLCDTADMSAVPHSKHVCRVTQQTCLLCHTADRSAVRHSRHAPPAATQNHGFVSQEGGGLPPPSCDTKPWFCVA